MNQASQISIVIPVYHRALLSSVLEALSRQTAVSRINEVVLAGIIDDITLPPGLNCKLVTVDPPTIPNNRNLGIQTTSTDWICMLDTDCIPEPQWLECLLQAISSGLAQAYAGAVALPQKSGYWSWCDHLAGFSLQAVGLIQPKPLPYAASLNFCVRRDVYDKLGGFDTRMLSSEDRDFCERLQMAGFLICAVPDAVLVHHHPRNSLKSALEHQYNYGKWTMHFRLKHYAEAHIIRRLYWLILRIPLLGEFAAGIQTLLRLLSRLLLFRYIKFLPYLPGISILEFEFLRGMINRQRTHVE